MDTYLAYLTLFIALVAVVIAYDVGILSQRAIDEARIAALEAELAERKKPMRVITMPDFEIDLGDVDDEPPSSVVYVYKRAPTAAEIAYGLELERRLEVGDVDGNSYDDPDDPDYVARVEEILKNWGPIE